MKSGGGSRGSTDPKGGQLVKVTRGKASPEQEGRTTWRRGAGKLQSQGQVRERAGGEGGWHPLGWEEFRWIGEKKSSKTLKSKPVWFGRGRGGGNVGNTTHTTSPSAAEGNPWRKWLWRRGGEPLRSLPGPHPRRLPLSWGKGCSSAWLPWLRNCDEPWERFCLCALRTDFRVKPSTFSEAEMAALAAPTGGDDDDIAAALALGSSGCCVHGTGSGRRRRGRGAESSRPSAPSPRPRRPPAPGRRRASPRRPPPPHGHISVPGVPGPRRAATSRGWRRQGRGRRGVKKLLTSGAEGGWKRAWSLDNWGEGAGVRTQSAPLFSSAQFASQPAGQPLTVHWQHSPPCLEPPPEALPSRVPSEPPPRCPLFPVSAGPSSPGAVTRRPGSGSAHTCSSQRGAVRAPTPTRPSAAHGEPPASDRYNLRRWRVHAGRGGSVWACARALGRASRGRGRAKGGEEGDWLTTSSGSRQPLGRSGGSRRWENMPVLSANRRAKRQERGWGVASCTVY